MGNRSAVMLQEAIGNGSAVMLLLLLLLSLRCSIAQHEYNEEDQLGYACTQGTPSCRAHIAFRGTTVQAALFGGSTSSSIQIMAVNCSCVSGRSQYNTTYLIQRGDTMYLVSKNTFQGLTTYQAVERSNPAVVPTQLSPGDSIIFPIRCACLSKDDEHSKFKSLLTYGVVPGDDISFIATSWNIGLPDILSENILSRNLTEFTTLLLPMKDDDPVFPPRQLNERSSSVGHRATRNNRALIYGLVAAFGSLLVFLFPCFALNLRRKIYRRKLKQEEAEFDRFIGAPKRFSYKQMQKATEEFSRRLGQGGFGTVFQGEIEQGQVAIKRLESVSQGEKEFKTEVSTIGNIQHFNLVQFKGFCAEGPHRLLVYELIRNGSLDQWLFHPGDQVSLDWETRIRIALGTARGLAFLHEECRQRILHLDVKPQNILLDEDFNAKVCDFGMSKFMKREESAVFTTMRGTPGYLAPEWLQSSITEKVDVYSFGVLLMELISGQRCLDSRRSYLHFPSWACQKIAEGGNYLELVDGRLPKELDEEKVRNVVDVALRCIENQPENRPSMRFVVQMLEELC